VIGEVNRSWKFLVPALKPADEVEEIGRSARKRAAILSAAQTCS
jgi:hypothetical protein